MGGTLGKKHGSSGTGGDSDLPLPGTSSGKSLLNLGKRKVAFQFNNQNSVSEFNLMDLANNITHRFSVLSGLSFISFVSAPQAESNKRPWSRVSRKRWQPKTLQNEYAQCKAIWPVAQTEALFLPEFPVGVEEKLKFIFIGEISRGAFGQVFHVKCASTYKEYAMKVLSKSQVCSLDAVSQVKQEVMIQHVCSHHPFITPLIHFWQTRKLLIVMTEYVGYGELQQLWRSLGRLPENLLSVYVAEVAVAIDFLHNAGVIYRDLKMENILLDADGHIKLIDFGLSRWLTYGGKTHTICGTLQFMAPEVLLGEEYGHAVDWWSLGIIAYSLLVGHYPVSGYDDHISMCRAVEKYIYTPPASASRPMKSLLMGLLDRNPAQRINALHKLQKEEIFKNLDFDDVRDKKVVPRKILEDYIEGRSRHNFEEFAGLTSTPKKSVSSTGVSVTACPPAARGSTSVLHQFSNSALRGGRLAPWDRSRRSSSSPLLSSPLMHPGRLGHHDALAKSISASGYNGAAVPLLQSPLLRLARGQGRPLSSKRSQRAVSASTLPTAVSPLLVNVKGNRNRRRWQIGERPACKERPAFRKERERENRESDSSCSPIHSDGIDTVSGMNGVYHRCASDECVRKDTRKVAEDSAANIAAPIYSPKSSKIFNPTEKADLYEKVDSFPSEPLTASCDNFLENVDSFKDEFFSNLVTSTPKRESVLNKNCPIRQSYRMALNSSAHMTKCGLLNGALLQTNNCSPLDENDFDDTLEHFPWISESIDTGT